MTPEKRAAIVPVAERQYGLFSVWQARDTGLGDHDLFDAVRRGELERIRPRVYLIAGAPLDWRTELLADVLAAPSGAVAARSAALRLHRVSFPDVGYRREILTLGEGLIDVGPDCIVHRTCALPAGDRTTVLAVPATTLARTVVDLTPTLPWWQALQLVDAAMCAHPRARSHVHETAQRLKAGRRGVARVMRATAPGAEEHFWSWLERKAAPLVQRAGGHGALWNVAVPGVPAAGLVDTYIPWAQLVIEWKGLAFHRRPDQLQRDAVKQNALTAAGVRTLSFTWVDVVSRDAQSVGMIAAALRRAA